MVSNVLVLILLVFGLFLLLWGFRYRQLLLPFISFGIGFTAAAGLAALLSPEGFSTSPVAWLIAIVTGVIYALMAVKFKTVGLILLAGALGYGLVVYLLLAVDIDDGTIIAFMGLLGAVLFVLYAIFYRKQDWMLVGLTALAGAFSLLVGVLVIFNQISVDGITTGAGPNTLMDNPLLWLTLWLILAFVGFVAQSRTPLLSPGQTAQV
ncbi:MAG: hypothetical protein BMS9Abin02_1280 [Anaerolineae bacterium]|nr:MAG: hypothetical protein BMS9Abin02_1280 [Anaerolineae bacterium]